MAESEQSSSDPSNLLVSTSVGMWLNECMISNASHLKRALLFCILGCPIENEITIQKLMLRKGKKDEKQKNIIYRRNGCFFCFGIYF